MSNEFSMSSDTIAEDFHPDNSMKYVNYMEQSEKYYDYNEHRWKYTFTLHSI